MSIYLDVREKSEVTLKTTIKGAVKKPSSLLLGGDFSGLYSSAEYYVFCSDGVVAQAMTELLEGRGFKAKNCGKFGDGKVRSVIMSQAKMDKVEQILKSAK